MKVLRTLAAATLAALSLSAHAVGSLADITIHDRGTGRDLPVYWHEGRAYVVGKPGNEYQINVRNRSGEDLMAIMSVDGVNVISGKTASLTQGGGYVLSSWENTSIRGWRKSMEEIASFYFTSLGDSYAARTGRPDNVGVIGVALYQRKRVEPPPMVQTPLWIPAPREEKSSADSAERSKQLGSSSGAVAENRAPAARPSAPLGTGHGRLEESRTQYVQFERATTEPVETIAIYYDSYRNLVAQGVIPTYGYTPRTPNPFPTGFVPDPR
jgi:hypothetical protein